jgi:ABC-type nickel/cobalt efflux system permease component RcnA
VKRLLVLLGLLGALAAPAAASAHPLGNFTVNRSSEIVLSGDRVYLRYALDLAEIPTFQLRDRARRPDFAASLARLLELRVDGRRVAPAVLDTRVTTSPGAGGLETLRFEAVYEVSGGGRSLAFRDRNFPTRRGWREVVVTAERGARIVRSSAPATSASATLMAYPPDLLREPLDVVSATVAFRPSSQPGRPPAIGDVAPGEREASGFEALVSRDLSAGFVLVSLALALFWGAAHAFSPGHGKAIVAGYLIGTRGTPRHAFLLGGIVTVTHTIGVFALGLVTLALSEFIVPEQLDPWLNLVAALLVVVVGVGVLRARLRYWLHARAHAREEEHHHGHGHHGPHHHPEPGGGLRGLVATGISGGIVPCPTALVVLLAAISLHRVGYGLVLIVAFSVGLAASVTGIGLLAVTAKRAFSRMTLNGPLIRLLPALSAVVVLGLGLVMTVRALPGLA